MGGRLRPLCYGGVLFLITAQVSGCAAHAAGTLATRPAGPETRLAFPEHVGAFSITDRHVYALPSQGVSARYSDGGDMRVDVYIYPVTGFTGVREGEVVESARALRREVRGFKEVLDTGKVRGWWDHYQVAYEEDASYDVPQGHLPGYLVMTVLTRGDSTDADAYYIFDVHNEFVKVRISMPYDQFAGGRAMTSFTDSLMHDIANEPH